MKALRFLLLVLLCLPLGGCAKIERARQCRALVAAVNPALGSIQELVGSNRLDVGFYEEVAVRYEKLSKELQPLTFSTPELQGLVEDYRGLLDSTARAVRGVGLARTNPQSL